MLAINLLAILVTTIVVGQLAVEAGASRWLGAAAGLYCGEMLGFLRDLSDPYSVMWVVVAVYLLSHQRYRTGALAIAAALLTREALIVYLPFLLLPLLVQRRWLLLAQTVILGFAPFVVWQLVLKVLYGPWALIAGDSQMAKIVPIPFSGLWHQRHTQDFMLMVMFVAVPMVFAFWIALRALWQRGPLSVLADPLPLMVIVYLALLSITYWFNWGDFWAPTRLAAPAVVLAVVIVSQVRAPSLRTGYSTLLAFSALAPLVVLLIG